MQKSLTMMTGIAVLFAASTASAQDDNEITYVPRGQSASNASAESDQTAADTRALQDRIDALEKEVLSLKQTSQTLGEKTQELQTKQMDATVQLSELSSRNSSGGQQDRFRFGSYGRVQPSMNPDGMRSARQTRLVSPTPRIDEGSYAELWFGYTPYRGDNGEIVDVVSTLALSGDSLFHQNGSWNSGIAIRNLYVEARNIWLDGLVFWAGSRMYRGDDIYLLDTWPLDNLNTYGGGIGYHASTRTNVDVHFGVNRLNNDYQYQVIDEVDERFVGSTNVVSLDRQRFISSLKIEQLLGGGDSPLYKIKVYGEVHAIGEGERIETQPDQIISLPSDYGWLIGAQFGISNFMNGSYVNLFLKYAAGLAAYGELSVPFGINTDLKAANAKNFTFGLSAGLNILNYVDILLGSYVRYFVDADGIKEDFDDGVDGVWDIRITGHVGDYFRPAIELSQQLRKPNGVNAVDGQQRLASIVKFTLLPGVRLGDGILGRPEFRLNYTVSFLNDAAQNMFHEKDLLRSKSVVHYLGFAAEWWFNL